MPHKRVQLRPLRLGGLSVLGDSLPERLRSTSVGLLGVVAASGLILVGVVLRQDFPLATDAPVPTPPSAAEAVHDRVVAKPAPTSPGSETGGEAAVDGRAHPARAVGPAPTPEAPEGGATAEIAPGPVGDKPLVPRQPPTKDLPGKGPPSTPVAEAPVAAVPDQPSEAVSPPEPSPIPEAAPEPAAPTHPGNGNAYAKGKENGQGNGGIPPGQAASKLHGHSAE